MESKSQFVDFNDFDTRNMCFWPNCSKSKRKHVWEMYICSHCSRNQEMLIFRIVANSKIRYNLSLAQMRREYLKRTYFSKEFIRANRLTH